MSGAMAFGSGPFGSSGPLISVRSKRMADLSALAIYCDLASNPGLRNPWRRDSLFHWRNWVLTGLSIGAKPRLARSVQWDSETGILLVNFDGRLTLDARYELFCAPASIHLYFTAIGAQTMSMVRREREQIVQDWAKPERSQDLQGGTLGTLQVAAGDYALVSGAASLYERIVRRVTILGGEYIHDPDYGARPRIGSLLTLDTLQRLQSRLATQIKREPDVVSCTVAVSQVLDAPGVVSVQIRAETVDGPLVISTAIGGS